jgi:hypothetical protein
MGIYENNREMIGADRDIALTVNDIERLSVIEPKEENFNGLIARLKGLSEKFPDNVRRYIDEISGVVEFTVNYYKEKGVCTPDINFLNEYGK